MDDHLMDACELTLFLAAVVGFVCAIVDRDLALTFWIIAATFWCMIARLRRRNGAL